MGGGVEREEGTRGRDRGRWRDREKQRGKQRKRQTRRDRQTEERGLKQQEIRMRGSIPRDILKRTGRCKDRDINFHEKGARNCWEAKGISRLRRKYDERARKQRLTYIDIMSKQKNTDWQWIFKSTDRGRSSQRNTRKRMVGLNRSTFVMNPLTKSHHNSPYRRCGQETLHSLKRGPSGLSQTGQTVDNPSSAVFGWTVVDILAGFPWHFSAVVRLCVKIRCEGLSEGMILKTRL